MLSRLNTQSFTAEVASEGYAPLRLRRSSSGSAIDTIMNSGKPSLGPLNTFTTSSNGSGGKLSWGTQPNSSLGAMSSSGVLSDMYSSEARSLSPGRLHPALQRRSRASSVGTNHSAASSVQPPSSPVKLQSEALGLPWPQPNHALPRPVSPLIHNRALSSTSASPIPPQHAMSVQHASSSSSLHSFPGSETSCDERYVDHVSQQLSFYRPTLSEPALRASLASEPKKSFLIGHRHDAEEAISTTCFSLIFKDDQENLVTQTIECEDNQFLYLGGRRFDSFYNLVSYYASPRQEAPSVIALAPEDRLLMPHIGQTWFKVDMNSRQAELHLAKPALPDGAFVIRAATRSAGVFLLSIRAERIVSHSGSTSSTTGRDDAKLILKLTESKSPIVHHRLIFFEPCGFRLQNTERHFSTLQALVDLYSVDPDRILPYSLVPNWTTIRRVSSSSSLKLDGAQADSLMRFSLVNSLPVAARTQAEASDSEAEIGTELNPRPRSLTRGRSSPRIARRRARTVGVEAQPQLTDLRPTFLPDWNQLGVSTTQALSKLQALDGSFVVRRSPFACASMTVVHKNSKYNFLIYHDSKGFRFAHQPSEPTLDALIAKHRQAHIRPLPCQLC